MSDVSGRLLSSPAGGPPLVRDHLSSSGSIRSFLSHSPSDERAFHSKLHEVRSRFPPELLAGAAALLRQTSDEAQRTLDRVISSGGAMVTTGQQAGLFGGPLFTLHKAVTAARLARRLERVLSVPVLPVFWIASDDHDWEEVNHLHLPLLRDGVRRLQLQGEGEAGQPMSNTPIGPDVVRVLDEATQVLSHLPFGADVLRSLRGSYRAGRPMSEAFGDLLAEWLGPLGICLVDSANPLLKSGAVPVLQRALRDHDAHEHELSARAEALLAAGYHVQVPVLAGVGNVAFHGAAGRERLVRERGGWAAPLNGAWWPDGELQELIAAQPERFSPTVLLRPVVESHVLPTLAYVGGPGEISYFAELEAMFHAFDIEAPVVVPRWSGTVVEPFAGRLLERLGLSMEDIGGSAHEVAERVARREVPFAAVTALDRARAAIETGYDSLRAIAGDIDPTLIAAMDLRRGRSLLELEKAERKIIRAVKRKESERLGQVERLRSNLRPFGLPQERVLGWIHFVATFGPDLVHQIGERIWNEPEPAAAGRAGALCS